MKPCQKSRRSSAENAHVITRRDFLHNIGMAAAGLAVSACQPQTPAVSRRPTRINTPVPAAAAKPVVAIAKADSYDPKLVKKQVQALLDEIGGISDVLAHGKRVAIKINLTGGTSTSPLPGVSEIESYLTHPEVVRALIELLRDAGAKDIYVVEAAYEPESWPYYGYESMAKATGAKIIDLTNAAPYKDFVKVAPGTDPLVYENFNFNPILQEIDAFVSISKLKCHNLAGVTHTMKNLFGLVPYRFYTLNSSDKYRSGFHGPSRETFERLPKVIVDLNRARPINLSLIDGILTTEGGEGPWINGLSPVRAGLLLAGKSPLATDAVATAVMSFDPTADYPNEPFVHANNHLNIAAKLGLGTNKLEDIQVVGESIEAVKTKFKVSY